MPIPQNSAWLLLLLSLFFSHGASAQTWKFKNEKEGVKVYYRNTGTVQDLKLTASVKTSLSGIIYLLNEVERYPQWGYKISESRLLEKISATELIYYTRFDFPWPLSDRDVIMRTSLVQDPKTNVVTAVSVSEPWHLAEYKDIVRIHTANTRWILHPNSSGWLYLEYYIHSDPGGSLPDWLVNMAVDVGPLETIHRIRHILKEPKYQQAKLAHIRE